MTWATTRASHSAMDITVVDHVDQVLINQAHDRRALQADVSALEDENAALRARLRRRRRFDIGLAVVGCVVLLAACAVFR